MKNLKKRSKNSKRKHPFRSIYCSWCKSQKSCGQLDQEKKYCCTCYNQQILEELEQEGLLVSSAQQVLDDYRSGVIVCQCLRSEKPRIKYTSSDGSGWIACEREECRTIISGAGHHGVIKNRNNPGFWGLNVKEKVLCGGCLADRKGEMKPLKRTKFNEYRRLGRL